MIGVLTWIVRKFVNLNYKILRVLYRLNLRVDAVNEAICLSVWTNEKHESLISKGYDGAKSYLSDEKITSGLYDWEWYLLEFYTKPSDSIVLIGAGSGRELYMLAQRSMDVKAYECALPMVNYANDFFRREDVNAQIHHLPANVIPADRCDVFWMGWGVYTHLMGAEKRIEMLRQIAQNLNPDGRIFLSFWFENRSEIHIETIQKVNRFINKRIVEPGESFRGKFWGKYYTREQIENEANTAGLKLIYFGSEGYGHAVLGC